MVTKPIEGLNLDSTYDFDKGYYYFRSYKNRIIFGGGRNLDFEAEKTDEFENTEKFKENLKKKLTSFWKGKFEVDYYWAGIMCFS